MAFFQAQGIGTPAVNLFAGSQATLPTGAGPYTRLTEYGGMEPVRAMRGVVAAEQPRVQVMVHAASYTAARNKAEAAYRSCLHATDGGATTLSGTVYVQMLPLQPPYDIGADANNRTMVGFNVQMVKKVSP